MVSEWNALNKKFQQVQDQNQKDIETRLQVIVAIKLKVSFDNNCGTAYCCGSETLKFDIKQVDRVKFPL